ncbi:MAG: polysulfide reductase NrfD, partial [Planctomycetes bacterium]|nr:polysulfide reductase NrfD [Planctomycetota bacterium]
MLEVAVCVTAYVLVLWIEFSPAFLERLGAEKQLRLMKKIPFVVVAIGVLLPTMHQSSLGSLLIAAGHKVYPLWQTNLLPLLFLISAIAMGFAIVIFEASLSAWGLRQPLETPLLTRLSRIMLGTLVFFLAVRFLDLVMRGQMGLAFTGSLQGNMFWVETLLFLFPILVLAMPGNRTRPRLLFASAVSLALG